MSVKCGDITLLINRNQYIFDQNLPLLRVIDFKLELLMIEFMDENDRIQQ
jgi:hypothetical protein